jgi:Zn-dependent protease with chaperone function
VATDFFDNQDRARRNTGRLVLLFVIAVLAIVAMLYAVAVLVFGYQGQDPQTGAMRWDLRWWAPELLVEVGLATLAVVAGGSLYKITQLRAGGKVVAEGLGGRLIHSDTRDLVERKLRNVVEEMAIASGTATPPVYMMDDERGINAFAAGFSPSDAVIGVTRGCAEQLSRDELQGVIAHEFSHILNGDMRLNIRLMGVIHGILIIGIIGYFLLRSSLFTGTSHRRGGRDNSGAALLAVGFGLMVVGFLGTFFGNLIKASVSRQREFLADSSAVQFTRNPDGIAGALKKIGGFETGSRIDNPNAPEVSHMFFCRGIASGLAALFSTHPPLPERIRRLDPSFEGGVARARAAEPRAAGGAVSGLVGAPVAAGAAIDQIGQTTPAHLDYAARLIASLPAAIAESAHETYGARAMIYALLIDRDAEARRVQLERLASHADPAVHDETRKLLPLVEGVGAGVRLPLIDMVIPALRELSPSQYEVFKTNVVELIKADRKIDLFEWTLQRILLHHLAPEFEKVRAPRVKYGSLKRVAPHCEVVLSTLAHAGARSGTGASRAFERGASELDVPGLDFLPADRCGLARLDEALSVLNELAPRQKRRLLHACALTVSADREVTVMEAELLRATADSLGCPMPPLLPGQPLV